MFKETTEELISIKIPKYEIELMDGSHQKWPIFEYALIGSDSTCHIQLNLPNISKRHARLEIKANKLIIQDMRSEDGTYVNSAQIIESVLSDGDLITIGFADFVIHDKTKI